MYFPNDTNGDFGMEKGNSKNSYFLTCYLYAAILCNITGCVSQCLKINIKHIIVISNRSISAIIYLKKKKQALAKRNISI